MLTTLRRYITRQSWRSLPLDLMLLPPVLTILPSMDHLWHLMALSALVLGLCAILGRGTTWGRLEQLWGLGFKCAALLGLVLLRPSSTDSPLMLQFAWLMLFGLWHTGRYLRNYWRRHQCPRLRVQDDSQRRIGALRQEYLRFDRILVTYSLTVCLIIYIIALTNAPQSAHWVGAVLVILSIWFTFALELTHLAWVRRQLHGERWVSILGAGDQRIGRVPLSIGKSAEGRMPLVRLVLWSQGMLYLERGAGGGLDTPFVGWQFEDETPSEAGLRLVGGRIYGANAAEARHLITYQGAWAEQSTRSQLLAIELSTPELLGICCKPEEGKWWQVAHLAHETMRSSLSPTLQEELPYLRQIMQLADRLRASRAKN